MDENLYVRIRGRIQGPFGLEKLRSLVRRGQLGRIHEVSKDRATWQRASEFPELFESSEIDVAPPVQVQRDGNPVRQRQTGKSATDRKAEAPWYYAQGDREVGPIDFATLRSKIANGEVSADDQVWTQGMADWAPASSVPELVAQPESVGISNLKTSKHVPTPSGGADIGRDVVRTLTDSRGWVFFLAICGFLFAAQLAAFGIVSIINGAKVDESLIVGMGLVLLLCASIPIWAGTLMFKYQSCIRSFVQNRSERRLEQALRVLKSFWIFSSIVLLFVLVLCVVLAIFHFADLSLW